MRAAETLGGGDVLTCDARDALVRLAGTSSHYSHLLVDRNDAEGLLDELADLPIEVRGAEHKHAGAGGGGLDSIRICGPFRPRHPDLWPRR